MASTYGIIKGAARHGEKCSVTLEVPGGSHRRTFMLPATEYNVASSNMNRAAIVQDGGKLAVPSKGIR